MLRVRLSHVTDFCLANTIKRITERDFKAQGPKKLKSAGQQKAHSAFLFFKTCYQLLSINPLLWVRLQTYTEKQSGRPYKYF